MRPRGIVALRSDESWRWLGHQVFETPIGCIALLICMDIHFVETARLVALAGADVICHISTGWPSACPRPTGSAGPSRTAAIWWKATAGGWSARSSSAAAARSSSRTAPSRPPSITVTASPVVRSTWRRRGTGRSWANRCSRSGGRSWRGSDRSGGRGSLQSRSDTTNLKMRYPTAVVRWKDLVSMRQPHQYQLLVLVCARQT
jgi:hypothetical protein